MLKLAPHPHDAPKGGFGASKTTLLAALGCGRLPGILEMTESRPFVVFGTMDGKVFAGLTEGDEDTTASVLPVYFYETG